MPPDLGAVSSARLACVVEDLALFAEGYARLLEEVLQAFPSTKAPVALVEYPARVHSLVALLDRAERWLETVDHAVGSEVILPGSKTAARHSMPS